MALTASRALLAFLAGLIASGAVPAETPEQLLDRLEARASSLATVHVRTIAVQRSPFPAWDEKRTEFWQERVKDTCRNRIEIEQAAVSNNGKRTVNLRRLEVDQGDQRWIEIKMTGPERTRILKDSPACANPFYAEIREYFAEEKATIMPSEKIDGTTCAVLQFQRGALPVMTTYWIAEQTGTVLRKTVTRPYANEEMHLVEFDTTGPIDESLFRYTPPDGAHVNEVGVMSAMLDRMERTRSSFASIYFETSTIRTSGPPSDEWQRREWLLQDGQKLLFRSERQAFPPEGKPARSHRILTVSDGVHQWREERNGVDVEVVKARASGPDLSIRMLRFQIRSRDAGLLAPREIEGERCSGVEIQVGGQISRYWFSERYGILWRLEHVRGGRTETVDVRTVTRVETNEPADPKLFTYTVPEGVIPYDSIAEYEQLEKLLASSEAVHPDTDTGRHTWRSDAVKRLEASKSVTTRERFSLSLSPDDRWLVFYKISPGEFTPTALVALDLASGIAHEFDLEGLDIETSELSERCWSPDGQYCFADDWNPGRRRGRGHPSFFLDFSGGFPDLIKQPDYGGPEEGEPRTFADFGYGKLGCSDCYDRGDKIIQTRLPKDYLRFNFPDSTRVTLARDGRKIYCQKRLGMAIGLYEYDLSSETDRRIARIVHESLMEETISEMRESPDGRFLAFHGAQQLQLVDLERDKIYRVADGVYHGIHWTSDSGRLFFYSCENPGWCGGESDYLYWVAVEDLREPNPTE